MSWTEKDNKLKKEYKFKDFVQAMAWITECAFHIEKQNHHPVHQIETKLCIQFGH